MDGVELAVCEPVRDVEDPVLIATPEMYVLPPDVIDTDVVRFMLLLDKTEPVWAVNPLLAVPGTTICEARDWLFCEVDATTLLLEDVEDGRPVPEVDDSVLLCTGAVPVVEERVTELPVRTVDAGATKLPVPDSLYSVCV